MRNSDCSIALLLLFGAAACNSIGLYPNVTLEDIGTPAVTAPFNLFIYPWSLEEQAKIPGNVTAVEYCFERPSSTPIQPVFTLLLLKPLTHGYRITDTIVVTTKNFSFCSNRGGINTCCERRKMKQQNQYSVPSASGIEAFGIYATGENSILGYKLGQQNSTLGFQVSVSVILNNEFVVLPGAEMTPITFRMFNFVIETSNSTTTDSANGGSVIPDGEENGGSQTQTLSVTDATAMPVPNSSSPNGIISVATDSEIVNHSSRTSSAPSTSSTSHHQESTELPTNELTPEAANAPDSSSITIIVASVLGGSIFVVLHIVILAAVIYLCYRAKKSGQTSDVAKNATVKSVVSNLGLRETDQRTVDYESIYAQATPHLCTNATAIDSDTDQHTYESSNYTLPIDTHVHGALPVVLDQNPAYGYHNYFELEDPYVSNSINKGLDKTDSYTKILPPSP